MLNCYARIEVRNAKPPIAKECRAYLAGIEEWDTRLGG